MAKRQEHKEKKEKVPSWKQAVFKVERGPLFKVAHFAAIYCGNDYPISKTDWAYVSSYGDIYLNPYREATAGEWEYVITHCLLHLGFGHFAKEKLSDPFWVAACDLIVTKFLRDSHIGTPPLEFRHELPFIVKSEDQAQEQLAGHCSDFRTGSFSTMTRGRPDMIWDEHTSRFDFTELFAESLQASMRNALRESKGLEPLRQGYSYTARYHETREWFISSYPLLGALAASFQVIDDPETVRRMEIPVAAISPQMQEIYINPKCRLTLEEWRFVLAHEFLHAALRHDIRCEDRDPELWNVACDYIVNGWLVEMDIGTMPDFVLFDMQYRGMAVEAVYDLLYVDIRKYRKLNPSDVIYGNPAWWDTLDGSEQDAFYRAALQQGLAYHQERGRGGTKLQPGIDLLNDDPKYPRDAPLLIITDGACDRLNLHGRNHAYLILWGYRLPFPPKGPVFRLK